MENDKHMNFLIRLLSYFHKPIEGDPAVWLERRWSKDPQWHDFKCGSVHGLYRPHDHEFQILAVVNTKNGNGHFEKMMEWFMKSATREHYNLSFLDVENPVLFKRLIGMGFVGNKEKLTLQI